MLSRAGEDVNNREFPKGVVMNCLVCMLLGAVICYLITNKQARDKVKKLLEGFGKDDKRKRNKKSKD